MNIFEDFKVSEEYDKYYETDFGKKVDEIEKALISRLIDKITPSKMLELGCGTGHWTRFFVDKGFDVTAIDSSESMLKIAINKQLKAEFLLANAEKLPFDDSSFETISTITMLEFVDNLIKVASEIDRVIKNNGNLIIGCLNKESVLWKNKENDKIFKNANFLSIEDIKQLFYSFDIIDVHQGVYLNSNFEICDFSEDKSSIVPAFNAILLRRKK